jgi:hypothetical protein
MKRAPTTDPSIGGETLNATEAARLLGIGRTRFWQLRVQYELQRVPWSNEARPRYRREDVLMLKNESHEQFVARMKKAAESAAKAANDGREWP